MGKQSKNSLVSIISPAFNEEEVISIFLKELTSQIKKHKINAEIIIIDDASKDNTKRIIKKEYPQVNLIKNTINLGQQSSILKGLKVAKGEVVVVLDSDLQDPPNLIPKLLKKLEKHDVVFARRIKRNDNNFKKITAYFYYRFLRIFSKNIALDCGDFFAAHRVVLEKVLALKKDVFIRGIFANFSNNIGFLEYRRDVRKHGKSGYNLTKMLKLAFLGLETQKVQHKGKIGIVGGGFQGLILAYFLSKIGYLVTVFEKEKNIGGLLSQIDVGGTKIERTYHHIFKTDFHFLGLLNSLKIGKVKWVKTTMSNYTNNDFFSTQEYLRKEVGVFSIVRFYIGIILVTIFGSKEQETAKKIVEKYFGRKIWEKYFSIIFEKKFGKQKNKISGKWFVSRIRKRFFIQRFGGEVVGYPKEGFGRIIKKLEKEIKNNKGIIYKKFEVNNILEKDLGFYVNNLYFDKIIDTRPPKKTKYYAYEGIVVKTNKKLSTNFWVNNLTNERITASINMSDLLGIKANIYYIGRYLPNIIEKSDIKPKNELLNILINIYNVSQKDILGVVYTKDEHAQPIFYANHKKLSTNIRKNYYTLSMAHIYPEDRGLNEAVKYVKKLVKTLT